MTAVLVSALAGPVRAQDGPAAERIAALERLALGGGNEALTFLSRAVENERQMAARVAAARWICEVDMPGTTAAIRRPLTHGGVQVG